MAQPQTGEAAAPIARPLEWSAVDIVKKSHREIEALFARWVAAGNDAQTWAALENRIARYFSAEEEYLYPDIRECGGERGRLYIAEAEDDHRLIRALLKRLHEAEPGSASWKELAARFQQDVLHHFQEEEDDLVPLAEDCLDFETQVRRGHALRHALVS